MNGLAYRYFEKATDFGVLPDFASLSPVRQGAVDYPDLTLRVNAATTHSISPASSMCPRMACTPSPSIRPTAAGSWWTGWRW